MTTRTWLGGGNDNAGNPADWSPTGAPQPGDTLILPLAATIDIYGNDLRGDALTIEGTQFGSGGTFNLYDGAQLTLNALDGRASAATIDVNGFATLTVNAPLADVGHVVFGMPVDLDLSPGGIVVGNFSMGGGSLDISGGDATLLIAMGTNTLAGVHATIDTNVIGVGAFDVTSQYAASGAIEFGGFVSPGEVISAQGDFFAYINANVSAGITIDHPAEFFGTIDLQSLGTAQFDGLPNATGWSYANDILSILGVNGRAIDRFNVISDDSTSTVHGLSLTKDAAGDVIVNPGTSFHGTFTT